MIKGSSEEKEKDETKTTKRQLRRKILYDTVPVPDRNKFERRTYLFRRAHTIILPCPIDDTSVILLHVSKPTNETLPYSMQLGF